ncbi:MAG: conserved phage C-terminal domain-containing protein, partial [Lysobacterales bacterium]
GIANCRSANEIDALRKILNKYFIRCEDGWYNKRMQQEIEKVERLSKTWSEAGKKGAQAKAKGRLRVGSALATTLSLSSSLSSHHPQKTKTLSRKRDVKPLAVEVLNFLNLKAGRAYRPTESNLSMIEARLLDGATLIDCKQVIAKKVREWGPDERMTLYLRPATLFNRTKFDQYVGELVEVNDGE